MRYTRPLESDTSETIFSMVVARKPYLMNNAEAANFISALRTFSGSRSNFFIALLN